MCLFCEIPYLSFHSVDMLQKMSKLTRIVRVLLTSLTFYKGYVLLEMQ